MLCGHGNNTTQQLCEHNPIHNQVLLQDLGPWSQRRLKIRIEGDVFSRPNGRPDGY